MSDPDFRSGPWTGFYTYSGQPGRHRMDLSIAFANGRITGEGNDDIGAFVLAGSYDAKTRECYWTKSYVGAHDVFYKGFREGKGIWGTWEIGNGPRGGFHIWPLGSGEDDGETESEETEDFIEAVGKLVIVGGKGRR